MTPATIAAEFFQLISRYELHYAPSIYSPLGTMTGFWFVVVDDEDE